ncbi:MAG TPA: UTP--glucose-1-phosphate uridylyltransferase [Patescibacteria group bacterium]|nr:UTP--glucose-1-phosphate uridylyltransferase [Patescibacteria group bacterium]
MKKVRKAVIPAAGFGTRFLPATKAQPKEMLPIVDKPVIQYVVEECVASGITDIIIVTGWHKRSIEDHFDYPYELETRLKLAGKTKQLEEIRDIGSMANFIYIRQKGPYGTATPVHNAKNIIGDEPFAVIWGDEFIHANPPRMKQCIEVYEEFGCPVISGVKIEKKEDLSKYGIADVSPVRERIYTLKGLVEKPKPQDAPSDIATIGCYILPPEIFGIIENLKPSKDGEYILAGAIDILAKQMPIYIREIENAKYYDCGDKLSYIIANLDFAMKRPDLAPGLREYMEKILHSSLEAEKARSSDKIVK